MCDEVCTEAGYGSCQDCGRLICFDVEQDDDILAAAYVTAAGDLFCRPCGREMDEAEEALEAEEADPLVLGKDVP